MSRRGAVVLIGVAAFWILYGASRSPLVVKTVGISPPEPNFTDATAYVAFAASQYDSLRCPPHDCVASAIIRGDEIELRVRRPTELRVGQSAPVTADLFYRDTLRPPPSNDSVGLRLIGSSGAVAIEPPEMRYSRLRRGLIGEWSWVITPQRPGSYVLLLEHLRGSFPITSTAAVGDRSSSTDATRLDVFSSQPDRQTRELELEVLTPIGITATCDAWVKGIGAVLTLLVAAGVFNRWLSRHERQQTQLSKRSSP